MIIYEANETDFFSNGLGTLPDATSALVTEERNGEFVLDVIYPQQGLRSELLTKNRIIKADAGHELKDQRFVIKKVTPTMDSDGYIYLTVHAEHVSYITADLGVTPNLTLSGNATQALEQWQANLVGGHPDITVDSDIISEYETNLDITKATNARQVLGGVEGSILDTWGGEYKFDNLHISLRGQRGTTANTLISYGRNLLTFEQEDDITDTYTSIYPYANVGLADGNSNKLITVDGYFVDSQYVDRYPNRKLLPVDFSSEFTDYKIGSKPSESDTGIYTTEAEIKKKLTELAKQYIENNRIGIPKVSTKITFADLSKTSEYAPLEQVNLCDIIPIRFEKLGIDTTIKVTRVVWNVLLDEYDSIELGDLRTTLGESISALESKTTGLANAVITAQSTADNQNSIFRTNGGTAEPVAKKVGDLWFKTDGDYQYMYQWDGAVWHEVVNTKTTDDIANQVDQARVKMEELVKKANNDTTIFRTEGQESTPIAKKKGDLWFKTDNGQTVMHEWDGQKWHEIVSTKTTENITREIDKAKADAKVLSSEVESAKKQAQEAFAKAGFNADEISNVKTATSEVTKALTSTVRQASELSESLKHVASETASQYSTVSSELSGARESLTAKASELAKEVASNSANITKANSQLYSQSEGLAKVSQSATKMEQTMTNLSGRVHTVETTASETKEALADAKGNITTLTKRADGTDTKIADAQGRVQTLESRAGKWDLELSKKVDNATYNAGIQNLGNQINLKANKSDLNGYATKAQLSVESGRITQQASEISSVTTIANNANSKIDNLSFGGRNLLDRSDGRFVMGSGITNTTWENGKAVLRYNSADVSHTPEILPQNAAFSLQFPVARGEQLTQSIYLDTDADINFNNNFEFSWFDSYGHKLVRANIDKIGQNTYRLWGSYTWDKNDGSNLRIMDIANLYKVVDFRNSGTYLAFYHPQIEKASRPSDYSLSQNDLRRLASEDTASQINQYNTGTVQPIKGIANDALGKANSANHKIDGLRIGGRNYLRESWVANRNAQSATYDSNTKTWTVKLTAGGGDSHGQGLQFTSATGRNLVIPYGQTAIISMEIKPEYNCSFVFDINNYPMSGSAWNGNDNDNVGERNFSPNLTNLIGGQWNKVFCTAPNTNPKNTNKVDIYDSQSNFGIVMKNQSKAQTVYIRYIMWELGTIAGNYYPSDLDLPDTIVTTVTEVSNAKQIVKSSGIYTDINSVRTETTGKIDAVNSRVSDVNDKIDNLKVGGTNLLNGSSTLKVVADSNVRDGTWRLSNLGNSTPLQNVTNELPPVVGVTNAIKISPLTGAAQDKASLSKGTYTFSVWLKGTKGAKYHIQPFWNHTATYAGSGERTLTTSDWDRVSFTVDLKTDESIISTAYVYNHDKTNVLYMAAPQLEKASRPSDYSLSQNDLQRLAHDDAASQINASITPISTTVTQYTNKTEELADSVTHFMGAIGYDGKNFTDKFKTVVETAGGTKETYKALEGKIDGIVVGGKNLLNNTDTLSPWKPTSNGNIGVKATSGLTAKYKPYVHSSSYVQLYNSIPSPTDGLVYNYQSDNVISLTEGDEYTISAVAWYYSSGDGFNESVAKYPIQFYSEYTNQVLNGLPLVLTDKITGIPTKYSYTFKCTKTGNYGAWRFGIYQTLSGFPGGSVFITDIQLEKGNKPSDWGMSDNDINKKISDANASIAKTNETIKTVDGTVATVKNNLDKTKSVVTQLANLFDVTVGDSSISVTNGGVLVKGKQVHIDGQTVIDNASIDGAKIKSLDAGKITTGTLNAGKLNVINLNANSINAGTLSGAHLHITKDSYIDNASIDGAKIKSLDAGKITTGTLNAASVKVINLDANNIKTGTLSGNNLSLNLDDGTVSFKKGKIVSSNNKLILNIDDGSLAVGDASKRQGMMFNQGKMYMYDQGYFGNSTWNGNVYDWMLEMKKHPYAVLEYSSSFSGTSGSMFGGSGANFHSTSGVAIAYDKNVSQTASAGTVSGIFDNWNPLDGHGVFINENGIAMGAEDKLVSIVGGTSFRYSQQGIWNYKPTILVGTNLWTDNVYDHGYNVNKMISDGPNIYMQASALITDTSAAIFNVENGDVEFAIKGNGKSVVINASGHTNNGLVVKGSQNITNWLGCQDLSVRGNKNSVVQTNQGWTKINAYETAEYYFGDLGTAITDDTSTVRIGIEPLFNETVNTDIPYQVFVTSYGEGYAWVAERGSNYFVIKSSVPNLEIGYEIKAKRKGYENVRLEIDKHMEVNKQ